MAQIPHFPVPFKFGVYTEQDSDQEIEDCVETIIRFPIGQRPEEPEFGIPDQTFAVPAPNVDKIQAAVSRWEPRANPVITLAVVENLTSKIIVEGGGKG